MSKRESSKPKTIDELDKQSKRLEKTINLETDIAKVLVATSFIDQILASILYNKFISSSVSNRILSNSGLLQTYQAKADMAYVTGLINKSMYSNLCKIGEIRNVFAHDHTLMSFDVPDINTLCQKLDYYDNLPKEYNNVNTEILSMVNSINSYLAIIINWC